MHLTYFGWFTKPEEQAVGQSAVPGTWLLLAITLDTAI